MRRAPLPALAVLVAGVLNPPAAQPTTAVPFGFLSPWIRVSDLDRARLDRGEVLARTLPDADGQVGVFVATRLNAPPRSLTRWTRAIADLKRSRFVLAIRRFSDPPAVSDLDALTLDASDLQDLGRCRPGDCDLKLSAPEIATLSAATSAGAGDATVQEAFRHVLLSRLHAYRTGRLADLAPLADDRHPRRLDEALSALVTASPYLSRLPELASWLRDDPAARSHVETFFYWSKDDLGGSKPVISLNRVGILEPRDGPDRPAVIVAGVQFFASHYIDAALGLTMVLTDRERDAAYLVYVNRSRVDVVTGFFGGIARLVLERRLERQAPLIVRGLRERLEGGLPPGA
jgi:hypothetical protein